MTTVRDGSDIFNVVLGTAGHIDHGKSTLVKRLTGIDPDRLPAEQRDGITIDLGFAPLVLPDGRKLGIVDVPGHERFVKNMVAGATGVDAVMLVVAADDGIMPQTREHLDILTLLGMKAGLVALTKVDAVDEELTEVVELELADFLAGTFLEDAPIVRVSGTTGQGVDDLIAAVTRTLDSIEPRDTEGVFRMPIQRVFSAKGFGTVVTGIPVSGSIAVGDVVEIQPGEHKGKIRGIQAYKQTCDRARAGHSTALNVADVDYKVIERGQVVAEPGYFHGSDLLECRLQYLETLKRPLRTQTLLRVHTGTSEVLGKVWLLEGKEVGPGQDVICQLRLEEPIVVAPGDRFIVRLHSPMITVGGGTVIGTTRFRLKARDHIVERLSKKEEALGSREGYVVRTVEAGGLDPMKLGRLVQETKVAKAELQTVLDGLVEAGRLVNVAGAGREPAFVATGPFEGAIERIESELAAFHEAQPFRTWLDRADLRGRLRLKEPLVFERALALAVQRERVVLGGSARALTGAAPGQSSGKKGGAAPGVRLASHEPRLGEREATFAAELERLFLEEKFQTPFREEALTAVAGAEGSPDRRPPGDAPKAKATGKAGGAKGGGPKGGGPKGGGPKGGGKGGRGPAGIDRSADAVFDSLLESGVLVAASPEIVFHRDAIGEAEALIRAEIGKAGQLASSDFKDLIGTTRKYVIPLLEYFDDVGLTARDGNVRRLRGS